MEIIRIPTSYYSQLEYTSSEDFNYILRTLFQLCNWEKIKVEKSMRGWLVISMFREAVQMENKARAKKWDDWLKIDFATLSHHMWVDNGSDQVTPNQIKSNQIKVSKETETKVSIPKKNIEIDNLIEILKTEADILEIAYDKKQERNFAKHILEAKEFGIFCEKIGQERIEFAKNIMLASQKINFWKWVCAWPMLIYQNYAEVYNLTKSKSDKKNEGIVKIEVLDF